MDIKTDVCLHKSIRPIDQKVVHKICSGQVILDLATAVKELVENSIDAKATLVEIKLREHGLEQIEVTDNGFGVESSNLIGLTAKYHTSKLREFSDLEGVSTFGFRGEALSSLCALSDMIITTRHASAEYGTKLELDHRGKIKSQLPCARQIGTTVSLTNLFATLPVRKKEFQKNIKKEFIRMCQILQAYCIVSVGVRIICTNQNRKGGKNTVMYTNGNYDIMDNISAIFGCKQTKELLEIKAPINKEQKLDISISEFDDSNINQEEIDKLNLSRFNVEGWISNCTHGSGRSSRDRQFFYVNSRPCEPKQIIKLVNEIYHRFNVHQNPFIFLNIKMERCDVDVNLTPDKRQVLVNNEQILLLAIKKSLLNTFENIPSTFKYQNLDFSKPELLDTSLDQTIKTTIKPNPKKFSEMLTQWKTTGKTDKPCEAERKKRKTFDEIEIRNIKMKKIQEILSQDTSLSKQIITEEKVFSYKSEDSDTDSNDLKKPSSFKDENIEENQSLNTQTDFTEPKIVELLENKDGDETINSDSDNELIIACKTLENNKNKLITEIDDVIIIEDISLQYNGKIVTLTTNLTDVKKLVLEDETLSKIKNQKIKLERLKFKAEINPAKNKTAEEELKTEITREMFSKMSIIGQFNLGFIITQLDDDLFIIDQHATDEKYNFEILQKTTNLHNQKLVIPLPLQLTALNEIILIENLNIFKMNGFDFLIDENAQPMKKVKLIAKPISQNWEFGKEDIDELIFMLQDAPNTDSIFRPSRVRLMFASRACRKSVMIGTSLEKNVMRNLVNHMGEIEHPWNCPHGRPTIRHLINLAMLESNDE